MVRDENFDDIPDLGPARDALDRDQVPTLKQAPPAAAKAKPQPRPEPRQRSSNGLVYLLLLVLIAVMGGFGFWSYQQQLKLERELAGSNQSLAQALDRVTDLEGLINATDESASKSGAALQAQLKKLLQEDAKRTKHVDSEIAKLWTIAYQRNKPKLEELDKGLAGVTETAGRLEQETASLKTQLGRADDRLAAGDQRLVALEADRKTSQTALSRLDEQMRTQDLANQEIDDLQEQRLKELEQQLALLKRNPQVPASLTQQLQEYGKSIESINAYRKQVNQELFRLRERVNQLQLTAEPPAAAQ